MCLQGGEQVGSAQRVMLVAIRAVLDLVSPATFPVLSSHFPSGRNLVWLAFAVEAARAVHLANLSVVLYAQRLSSWFAHILEANVARSAKVSESEKNESVCEHLTLKVFI
jgi:hypothetical protein